MLWGGLARPREGVPWTRDTLTRHVLLHQGSAGHVRAQGGRARGARTGRPVAAYWPSACRGRAGAHCPRGARASCRDAGAGRRLTLARCWQVSPVAGPRGATPVLAAGHRARLPRDDLRLAGRRDAPARPPEAARGHFEDLFGGVGRTPGSGLPVRAAGRVGHAEWDPDGPASVPRRLSGDSGPATVDDPGDDPRRRVRSPSSSDPAPVSTTRRSSPPAMPAVGVVSTARSLARVWSRTVGDADGCPPLLVPRTIADATRPVAEGKTGLAGRRHPTPAGPRAHGALRLAPMLSEAAFGHDGAGGQLCFADPRPQRGVRLPHQPAPQPGRRPRRSAGRRGAHRPRRAVDRRRT